MNIVIIEDEPLVCDHLASVVRQLRQQTTIVETLDTVGSSIDWFRKNQHPDLVFSDIRLSDGLSFDIFDSVEIESPVIFTTAYDEYAIRAFKVNSIDYLLKPISQSILQATIDKMEKRHKNCVLLNAQQQSIATVKKEFSNEYKSRFVIKVGEHLKIIPIEQVSFFISLEKTTWIYTTEGRQYPIDTNLDSLTEAISPLRFFRINRKLLVALDSIADIVVHSGSRLQVKIAGINPDDSIVSRERVNDFKMWIEGY